MDDPAEVHESAESGGPAEHRGPDTPRELKARALRLLMRREHGRAELVRRLSSHAESMEALEQLLDELVRRKLLSEDRVAESRATTLSRKFGVSRIRHDLRAKGIAEETIDRVAAEAQATEFERAKEIWQKKFRELASNPAERAKQMRFLAARGFSHETIRSVLDGK